MSNDELKDILIGLVEDWSLAAIISENTLPLDDTGAIAYNDCRKQLQEVIDKIE